MNILKFQYQAVRIQQSKNSKPLIMFGANAIEISKWAGIPQKKSFQPDTAESSGFQRTENQKRLKQLSAFYGNESNVIQNSLICALKDIDGGKVEFLSDSNSSIGTLTIEFPDLYSASFERLFFLLRQSLEKRIGNKVVNKNDAKYLKLKSMLQGCSLINNVGVIDEDLHEYEENEEESVIFDETHLDEFLLDVSIRHELLKELKDQEQDYVVDGDVFLGFDRESLLSFLLPLTLVDGQHRLKGATLAAEDSLLSDELQLKAIEALATGDTAENVTDRLLKESARILPVSLLMENDPKEQVFQFVVINQKATPIGKSLLGTIISTSLTTDEMETVTGRLKQSGIELEDARAITWAARNPISPFFNLVERGIQADNRDLLQWNVMGALIQIFKELRGGSLYHARNDYAKRWKEKFLAESGLVIASDPESAFEEWRKLDGVWRNFFVTFWTKVKNELANDNNTEKFNYWGNTRRSNLFNKISLTILAADFFKYLVTTKRKLNIASDIDDAVTDWLDDVNRGYFDRDWELSGVKKDSTGIRAKWSENWSDYRENPDTLPQIKSFRTPKKSV